MNCNEKEAIEIINKNLEITISTGKDRYNVREQIMIKKIVYMINNLNINPERIALFLISYGSVTNMKEKLSKFITKSEVEKININVLEKIAERILQDVHCKITNNTNTLGISDNMELFRKIYNKYRNEISLSASQVYHYIREQKLKLITPEHMLMEIITNDNMGKRLEVLYKVYYEYEFEKDILEVIDFDDLLYKLYYILERNDNIKKEYTNIFDYVLIDTNVNIATIELIKIFCKNNIFYFNDIFYYTANLKKYMNAYKITL